MNNFYCIDLKFKDTKISDKVYHSHLYSSDKGNYLKIWDENPNSEIDTIFMRSENALDYFYKNFEIIKSDIEVDFELSKIYKVNSFEFENEFNNIFFTIHIDKVILKTNNLFRDKINEGEAYLDNNGLKMVNLFYSFFTNLKDINTYSISRMNGKEDIYIANEFKFRPELVFIDNEKRNSDKFTINKIPIIKFYSEKDKLNEILEFNDIVSHFFSFCFGIKISFKKIVYRTENNIFVYRNTKPKNKKYKKDLSIIFTLLNKNCRIEKILKTNWFEYYKTNNSKITKAINNYLHSREVDLSSSFLLLFNIIEILNIKPNFEKFEFLENKEINFLKAYDLIIDTLKNDDDKAIFKNKWEGIKNKLDLKPMKSPLENTLLENNINPENYGFSFNKLKNTRDKITHGSVNTIDEEVLKQQIYCLRKITGSLILANLGFKDDLIIP